jgi:hypothetical protein
MAGDARSKADVSRDQHDKEHIMKKAQPTAGAPRAGQAARTGARPPRLAICLVYVARVLAAQGKLPAVRATISRAVAMYEQVVGRDSPNLREALLDQGTIELALRAPSRALPPLERAFALGPPADALHGALLESALGRALVDSHRDPARGMALVRAAKDTLEHNPLGAAPLRDLARWRPARGP